VRTPTVIFDVVQADFETGSHWLYHQATFGDHCGLLDILF